MIDTHAHLNHESLQDSCEDIVLDAVTQGVEKIVCVGYDLPSSQKACSIADEFPNVFSAIGIHPHDAKTYNEQVEKQIEILVKSGKVVAIGEIGLDYHYDFSAREIQRQVFISQILLAHKFLLPIVIHTREAMDDTLEILNEYKDYISNGGILHCFDGTLKQAKQIIDLGFMLGFGGMVTFRDYKYIKDIPLDRMVLETDCPYLSPAPFRGKTNQPKYLYFVCEAIALLTGKSFDEIDQITTENAKKVYGI